MEPHYPLFYVFHFYLFGVIALASAIAFVTRKSPVAAALWLVNTMFSLAALYVMLDAQFIGVMQVLVYAGAIMVVFLFVVMLLNLGHPSELADARGTGWKLVAGLVGLGLLSEIMVILRTKLPQQLRRAARLQRAAAAEAERRRHHRRAAVQGLPAGIRADERAAAGGDCRRRRAGKREDRPCSLSRSR